ncbi:hypothetical protein NQ317_016384 [Molorchus minor]|uniref:Uncharacterized protein n=1 Tax=Molorchus minor TaxID=1323400 RepID=A0ABQ9JKU2_9CUCU|nr:hypothetical protein NQ317_016384 [Molorchus minor]
MKYSVFALLFAVVIVAAVGQDVEQKGGITVSAKALKEISDVPQPRSCDSSSCNSACVYYGYLGGFCMGVNVGVFTNSLDLIVFD